MEIRPGHVATATELACVAVGAFWEIATIAGSSVPSGETMFPFYVCLTACVAFSGITNAQHVRR